MYVDVKLWGFSCTLVVQGALDKYIRFLESIPPSSGKPFYVKLGQKHTLFGGSVDLSHLHMGC